MRQTLLEMTQDILNDMSSDNVDSITDTVESYSVAQVIRRTFYDMAAELQLPAHNTIFQLTASGDAALPCLMTAPTNMQELHKLEYDNKLTADTNSNWQAVEWMEFDDFLHMTNMLEDGGSTTVEMDVSNGTNTFEIKCRNDKFPQYFTTFDNTTFLFDSFESDEDTTLQASKVLAHGLLYPTFTMSDGFYPSIHPTQFPYLYNKAKTRCFLQIKQMENPESAAESRNQKIRLMEGKTRTTGRTSLQKTPRYGRYGY